MKPFGLSAMKRRKSPRTFCAERLHWVPAWAYFPHVHMCGDCFWEGETR